MTNEIKTKEEEGTEETLSETIGKMFDVAQEEAEDKEDGESEELSEESDEGEDEDGDEHSDEGEKEEVPESKVGDDSELEEEEESDEEDEEIIPESEVEAPSSWSDDAKEEFSELPASQQENIVKAFKGMQADYTNKLQGISQVVSALKPIEEECVESGTTYPQAIARMVGAHVQLKKNPAEAMRGLMGLYGVTAEQVLGVPDNEGDNIPSALKEKIDKLEAQVNETTTRTREQMLEDNKASVIKFKENAEFYEEVEEAMGDMAEAAAKAGQSIPSLEELYDRACWLNPSVREKKIAKQRSGQDMDRVKERKKRVAKSKRASRVAKRSSAAPDKKGDREPTSLRDVIEQQFDASTARSKKRLSGN